MKTSSVLRPMLKWCARPLRCSAERKLPHSGPRPWTPVRMRPVRDGKYAFSTSSCRGKAGFPFSSSALPRSLTIEAVTSWDMGGEGAQCDGDEYDGRKGSHFFKTLKKISLIEDRYDLIMATERNFNILKYFTLSLTSPSLAEFSCSATLPKAVLIWKQLSFHALSMHPELFPAICKTVLTKQNLHSLHFLTQKEDNFAWAVGRFPWVTSLPFFISCISMTPELRKT